MTQERKKIAFVAIISLATALIATSCMQVNKSTDETDKSVPMYVKPDNI